MYRNNLNSLSSSTIYNFLVLSKKVSLIFSNYASFNSGIYGPLYRIFWTVVDFSISSIYFLNRVVVILSVTCPSTGAHSLTIMPMSGTGEQRVRIASY